MDIRSVLAGGRDSQRKLAERVYPQALASVPEKLYWFAQHGYVPHVYQTAFHGAQTEGHLTRFRHLVAGRRGGKTLSAAWEVLFYALHPEQFHRDAHGVDSSRSLMVWMLAKDYPTGKPSIDTLLEVIAQAGLIKGRDFQYNKTERRFEFYGSGSVIQFRTAEDPQSLRGAGIDILWMDEAAFITTADAYIVASPALADRVGLVITTTTPYGKNWLHEEFFTGPALKDPNEFRVQYTSLDNPYFTRAEWERYKRRYHPVFFKQEFMASFDAFAGVALQGEWLRYWVSGKVESQTSDITIRHLKTEDGRYRLRIFLGIDPAVSLSDSADHFAMAVIGITDDNEQAFLLDTFLGRVPFPDQVGLIKEWQLKWRPELIGVESNAFQKALAQQSLRLEGFPGIVPVMNKGDKNTRILSMSPLFKIGRIRINRRHGEFIDQWVSFDPEKKNQKDDLLDAVEIALGVAGVILPAMPHESAIDVFEEFGFSKTDHSDVKAMALRDIREKFNTIQYDPEMGEDW